jgi:hypothetical protein
MKKSEVMEKANEITFSDQNYQAVWNSVLATLEYCEKKQKEFAEAMVTNFTNPFSWGGDFVVQLYEAELFYRVVYSTVGMVTKEDYSSSVAFVETIDRNVDRETDKILNNEYRHNSTAAFHNATNEAKREGARRFVRTCKSLKKMMKVEIE